MGSDPDFCHRNPDVAMISKPGARMDGFKVNRSILASVSPLMKELLELHDELEKGTDHLVHGVLRFNPSSAEGRRTADHFGNLGIDLQVILKNVDRISLVTAPRSKLFRFKGNWSTTSKPTEAPPQDDYTDYHTTYTDDDPYFESYLPTAANTSTGAGGHQSSSYSSQPYQP